MVDKFLKQTRSKIMSRVQRNSKPEQILRKGLFRLGYRYSLNHRFKELNFKPDIVMVSRKVCIFVDGCFWHKCPRCFKAPKSNKKYWGPKIKRNAQRDRNQDIYLRKNGWKVIRVWEHEIRKDIHKILSKVNKKLKHKPTS